MAQKYILSEFLVDNPKHTTAKEIKEEKLRHARSKMNLNEPTDIKNFHKDPALKYVTKPEIRSKTEKDKLLKEQNLKELSKFGMNLRNAEIERLNIREDCALR